MVVRISKGRFPPERAGAVERSLQASEALLRPAVSGLAGLSHYYVGIDRATSTMTNTSVWESRDHAMAMGSLKAMLDLRAAFEAAGVEFEPITNQDVLWEL